MHSKLPLVEPIHIVDTFVSGIADIEEVAEGTYRIVLYSKRRNAHDKTMERVVVASLIMDRETIVRCIFETAKSIDFSLITDVSLLPRDNEALN